MIRDATLGMSRANFLCLTGGAVIGISGCAGGGASVNSETPQAFKAVSPPSAIATAPTPASTPIAQSEAIPATITISRTLTQGTLPEMLAGLSYEKSKIYQSFFTASNRSLIGCFNSLGKSILRIGGNSVDSTVWAPTSAGTQSGYVAPSDVLALAQFLAATGWRVLYGINMATNNPALAASEAEFVAQALGSSLYGFEIGNECDEYASNGLRPKTYTAADFIAEWQTFANAIKASVPGVTLSGPGCAANIYTWTMPFASSTVGQIGLLTQHYYRANGNDPSSTMSLMLSDDPNLPLELQRLQSSASSNRVPGGYRWIECNSFYNGGAAGVSDAFGSALWAIDFMMLSAEQNCSGVNFHGGGNSAAYAPIVDNNTAVTSIRPEFYAMMLISQIVPGPMYPTHVDCSLNVSAYAIAGSDGALYLVLVNKDPENAVLANISLGSIGTNATSLTLSGGGLNSTSGTLLGGAQITDDGSLSSKPMLNPVPVVANVLVQELASASAQLIRVT